MVPVSAHRLLAALAFLLFSMVAHAQQIERPTNVVATAGVGQATITFSPSVWHGAQGPSGYEVFSTPAGGVDVTGRNTSTTHVVKNLVAGQAYTFIVRVYDFGGTYVNLSFPSNSVTPTAGPPEVPTNFTVVPGVGQATLTLTPPVNNGGAAITSYTATWSPAHGVDTSAGTNATTRVITGLTNGVQYTFSVVATNPSGSSPATPQVQAIPRAAAATITVNNPFDNDNLCTLRRAVENASGLYPAHPQCAPGAFDTTIAFDYFGYDTYAIGPEPLNLANNSTAAASITLQGNGRGRTIINGQGATRIFENDPPNPITIRLKDLSVVNGHNELPGIPNDLSRGGAIYFSPGATAYLDNVAVVNNNGSQLSAVYSRGSLTVSRSTFQGNGTGNSGFAGAITSYGGLVVSDSTFEGNTGYVGGAILHFVNDGNPAKALTISNSTFTGNHGVSQGGAIFENSNVPTTLTHVTITGNSTDEGSFQQGGGVVHGGPGVFTLDRSIIAGNTSPMGADCMTFVSFNQIVSAGYNVVGSLQDCNITGNTASNIVGPALLGAIGENGGPTRTIAPLAGSPAIDRAPTCTSAFDQRGRSRPQGAGCESGAFEITAPDAPYDVSASMASTQATVTFTPPGVDGGSPITGYTVVSNPAGGVDTNANTLATSHVVTGLVDGVTYVFTVRAVNAIGTGPASDPSYPAVFATVPGAPSIFAVNTGNGSATVFFSAPALDGASPITGYTVTSNPAGGTDSNAGTLDDPHVVTGLTNGVAYTFTVTATNSVGTGPASAPSGSVTPNVVPDAPSNVVAAATGGSTATVTFAAPAPNGGTSVTGYSVFSEPSGAVDINAGSTSTSHAITGLQSGNVYTFYVVATNAAGSGPASAPSNALSFVTVPAAPNMIGATPFSNAGPVQVVFDGLVNDGGSPITGFTVYSNPPGGVDPQANTLAQAHNITGLTPGVSYTFTVRARNAIGEGPASQPSNAVTLSGPPGAPTNVTVTYGSQPMTLVVSFTPPADNGSSPITGYFLSSPQFINDADGGTTKTSHLIVSLSSDTTYTFTARARNVNGFSSFSAESNAIYLNQRPGAPTNVTAEARSGEALVSFAAPAYRGNYPPTGYTVTSVPGGVSATGASSPLVVGGLTNGIAYTFVVTAQSLAGPGDMSAPSNSVTPANPPAKQREVDFNADVKSDVLIRNVDGSSAIWLMNGTAIASSTQIFPAGTAWQVAHMVDLNGDFKTDLVWQHPDGRVTVYLMDGATAVTKQLILPAGGGWTVTQAADLDGDGKADLVFQNADGTLAAWLMNGATMTAGGTILGPGSGWSITKTGDFNGDGKADLLFTHTDGRVAIWLMNGLTPIQQTQILNAGSGWSVSHVADLDGDGKADLVWRNTDGRVAAWLMNGTAMTSGAELLNAGTGWTVTRTGDFDGDHKADLLFEHTDGRVAIFLMNGLTPVTTTQILNGGSGWSVKRTADLNGDGKSDLVWQNADGRIAVWLMNGTTMVGGSEVLGPGTGWTVSTVSQ
ncbi:hypothetical protein BWI17_14700 [Betaproteobacteria bacterium GR16-43]|nr:hypothetical protein BWI17_14700 [Betaproteobacteria bacterium GR16-43]